MPTSQKSFQARYDKFLNGNSLIQSYLDYASSNPIITKAALTAYVAAVLAANNLVTSTEDAMNTQRDDRHALVFRIKDTNPACLELRIAEIHSYLSSELGSTDSTTKKVGRILAKIRPHYKKKDPNAPPVKTTSPSEKSYNSAPGFGDAVITLITGLGVSYVPVDTNLTVANMTTLLASIRLSNKNIILAEDAYKKANKSRKDLYENSVTGMDKRITQIKSYLASFAGGKKSPHYVAYAAAIKGV